MSTRAALTLIARFPPDPGEAVLLRVVMGLDAKTAAKVLGKRAGAVRTAACPGLRELAAYLEETGRDVRAAAKGAAKTQRRAAPARALDAAVSMIPKHLRSYSVICLHREIVFVIMAFSPPPRAPTRRCRP